MNLPLEIPRKCKQRYFILQINENIEVSYFQYPEEVKARKERSVFYNYFIRDLSFIVLNRGKPVALCILFLEKYEDIMQFSFCGGYLSAPFIADFLQHSESRTVEQFCFKQIDNLAKEHNVKKVLFMIEPSICISQKIGFNVLMRYGFIDTSIATQVVNLSYPKEILWKRIRKSYKSIIKKAYKMYEFMIYDAGNPEFQRMEDYRLMHHKCAGRVTRPKSTFHAMYKMLLKDKGMLLCVQYQKQNIGFFILLS